MYWLLDKIGRPREAHGVNSPEEYMQRAKEFLIRHGQRPILREREGPQPVAYVSDGRWVCDCDCGNGPSVDPEWRLAVCFECGSIWRPVIPARYREAERVLLARPSPANRHWFPDPKIARRVGLLKAETIGDLKRDNQRMGLPAEIPDEEVKSDALDGA